jgi:hypothetical protein
VAENTLAWIFPVVALVILWGVIADAGSPIGKLVTSFLAFAVVFGCVHFLYYRANPDAYIVSKDLPLPEAVKALVAARESVRDDVEAIAFLDAALLQMNSTPEKINEGMFVFEQSTRTYSNLFPGIEIETTMRTMALVGPKLDPLPVYLPTVSIRFTDTLRGIAQGKKCTFKFDSTEKPSLNMHRIDFDRAMLGIRDNLVEGIESHFQQGSAMPALFSLADFFYLAFSITGVGELIPATTKTRMIVVLQIIFTLTIPFAIDHVKKPREP